MMENLDPSVSVSLSNGVCKISGVLDFKTVPVLADKAYQYIQASDHPTFDLKEVTKSESPALALLASWSRQCRKVGKTSEFIHVPQKLMDIAKLSNLDKVLSMRQ